MGSNHPIIVAPHGATGQRVEIDGQTICIHEWRGSGPATMHVHHDDDEAWHVLEGELRFRFGDRTEVAPAGSTVFVPAGVAHTYEALPGARYLIILTPRLRALIAELQSTPHAGHPDVYRRHASELLE
jgi:mannose-6-phosphate isomerase-like protein (cupin superfamily)